MHEQQLKERFCALRAREFKRLDESGHVYLDYTGSGLYAESQLRRHEQLLEHHVLGNPHSENPASLAATRIVEDARRHVLDFFRADPSEYTVIFTANASAALKLVGEAYPFEESSRFVLLQDSHNSVNGIRLYAEARAAEVHYLPLDAELRLDAGVDLPAADGAPALFAYPAQSNFSGVQHPLSLVERARARGYTVILDAAAFVPTSRLDLTEVRPDFTCVSFYKMFGFPTGVGALIARKEALAHLRRPWFAGGTVEWVSVGNRIHRLRADAGAFEDGTPNFLGIAAVSAGLSFLEEVGMEAIHERVGVLTARLLEILCERRHANGAPLVEVYGPRTTELRGGTVAFNVLDADGRCIPYGVVEHAASERNISLRGGCFCNPGAAEAALDLPPEETRRCFEDAPPGSFSLRGLADCLGGEGAVGALRASLGIATNEADLDRLDAFLGELAKTLSSGAPAAGARAG